MELSITKELEPLPIRYSKNEFETPQGLLNSNYKNVVKCSLNNHKATSIFGVKRRVRSRQYHFNSSIETLLKVSIFVIALAIMF